MTILDAHAHASPYWQEPVESLLFQMNSNGVDKSILVAMAGHTDDKYNEYLLECARKYPQRFSAGVIVDVQRSNASKTLKRWVENGADGIRLDCLDRSPGKDPWAIWKTCAELGICVSCHGRTKEVFADESFHKIVEGLPDLTFILEHLGKAKPDEKVPYPVFKKTLSLSKFPNVYMKVGGLSEISKRPFPFRDPFYTVDGIPPFIKMTYEAFGPSRMMWGSNYPPCSQAEGYKNTIRYLDEHLDEFCSQEDKEWIFGKTAVKLFKFA